MKNKIGILIILIVLIASLSIFKNIPKTSTPAEDKYIQDFIAQNEIDYDRDGLKEKVQIWVIKKNDSGQPILNNALFLIVKDKRIIVTKFITLQYNNGKFELGAEEDTLSLQERNVISDLLNLNTISSPH